jgi:surface antigen
MRYHQLTDTWVPPFGDAYQWLAGAKAAGWVVSMKPHVPSIIVLQPGVQSASKLGHVAVVERINHDGTVYTSNYNWPGVIGWDTLSYVTFTPGPQVFFVWKDEKIGKGRS